MSRRFANRPRHQLKRIYPKPSTRNSQEYLRQHWIYRQQHPLYPQRPPGYGLSLIPYGWQRAREVIQRQA